jgi:flagellar motor protein MotB
MTDPDDEIPTQSYWPSVTDLFLTLFIIAIAIVAVVFCALLPTNNVGKDRALVHAVGNDLLHVREPMNRLRQALDLEPIEANIRPSLVIAALSDTCDAAVSQIEILRSRIKDIEERLTRLMGSKDQQEELERLLRENEQLKKKVEDLQEQMAKLFRTFGSDPEAIEKMVRENSDLKSQLKDLQNQLNDKPPIIQISEQKEDYRFESGSSEMSKKFVGGLNDHEFKRLADEIIARQEEGRVKVDTLEIIGHTDGAPLSKSGNLDQKLPDVLAGNKISSTLLTPGSNNDLGLLRALAVREQWSRYVSRHEHRETLGTIHVRCYSAGQTILPEGLKEPNAQDFRKPDSRARRIEMRLTRLSESK